MKIYDSDAYKLLEKYKIKTVRTMLAKNVSEAELIAANIKFPAVIKIDSPDIVHKSREGCIDFVYNDNEMAEKFKALLNKAKKLTDNINGVIIQEKASGLEIIAGAKQDEQFGSVIMFGFGGVLTEMLKDVSVRLVPISEPDAKSMIDDTKAGALLSEDAKKILADMLMKISNMIEKEGNIRELDINPIIISGEGALACDVRIIT